MNVILIGSRGSGKSTVGRCLAERLGWRCVDADVELQRRAGRTIKEIFAQQGESAFREMEAQLLLEFAAGDRQMVALGGGVVLRAENREVLKRAGFVVWLTADVETLWQRLEADQTTESMRPNLTAEGGLDEVARLLQQREPWYRACADLIVDTAGMTVDQVADRILSHWKADL